MGIASKSDSQSQPEQPFVDLFTAGARSAGNHGVAAQALDGAVRVQHQVRYVRTRVGEMGSVGQIQRFGAELHLPALRKTEITEQTDVEIECARTANRVQRRGSNGPGGARSKGQWIEV